MPTHLCCHGFSVHSALWEAKRTENPRLAKTVPSMLIYIHKRKQLILIHLYLSVCKTNTYGYMVLIIGNNSICHLKFYCLVNLFLGRALLQIHVYEDVKGPTRSPLQYIHANSVWWPWYIAQFYELAMIWDETNIFEKQMESVENYI